MTCGLPCFNPDRTTQNAVLYSVEDRRSQHHPKDISVKIDPEVFRNTRYKLNTLCIRLASEQIENPVQFVFQRNYRISDNGPFFNGLSFRTCLSS